MNTSNCMLTKLLEDAYKESADNCNRVEQNNEAFLRLTGYVTTYLNELDNIKDNKMLLSYNAEHIIANYLVLKSSATMAELYDYINQISNAVHDKTAQIKINFSNDAIENALKRFPATFKKIKTDKYNVELFVRTEDTKAYTQLLIDHVINIDLSTYERNILFDALRAVIKNNEYIYENEINKNKSNRHKYGNYHSYAQLLNTNFIPERFDFTETYFDHDFGWKKVISRYTDEAEHIFYFIRPISDEYFHIYKITNYGKSISNKISYEEQLVYSGRITDNIYAKTLFEHMGIFNNKLEIA